MARAHKSRFKKETFLRIRSTPSIFVPVSEMKTIADAILAIDAIVQESAATQNRAGYFAALYKRMTMAVNEGIRQGSFEDSSRMEAFDVSFAQRYLTAFDAFKNSQGCSSSWQQALTGCGNRSLIVLQHLLLGINTHINLDLAIAAATVAPGDRIHALEADFNRINLLIASLVDDVQQCLEEVWFPMRFFRDVVNKQGRSVLNFSINIARQAAWNNAVKLAGMAAPGQEAYIKTMDDTVRKIGDRIIHPGFWPQLLLRAVRFTEYEDVARTIRLIDTTVVE